jgi:CO/xanthine dehydrogenase FAD-binding subunit
MRTSSPSYWQAQNLNKALQILQNEQGNIKVLAGGTDLMVQRKEGIWLDKSILDIWKLKELDYICEEKDSLRLGARVTMDELITSPLIQKYAQPLHLAACVFASPQIRNRATLGGNINNASPAADTLPALYVLNAKLKCVSVKGERVIPIHEFFLAPRKTLLKPDEMLAEITIDKLSPHYQSDFYKLGERNAVAIAVVNLSICRLTDSRSHKIKDIRIAYGSVAPTVIRAPKTEQLLLQQKLSDSLIEKAAESAQSEVSPISDIRASAFYRKEMAGSLLKYLLRK